MQKCQIRHKLMSLVTIIVQLVQISLIIMIKVVYSYHVILKSIIEKKYFEKNMMIGEEAYGKE